MKLVIDIPEETYTATCQGHMLPPDVTNVIEAIKAGAPLPKHGYLIDIDTLKMEADDKKLEQILLKIEREGKNNGQIPDRAPGTV